MVLKITQNTFKGVLLSVSLQNQSSVSARIKQQIAISIKSEMAAVPELNGVEITPEAIPLQRLPDHNQIIYRSAIALKLASSQPTILNLAQQIMAALLSTNQPLSQPDTLKTLQLLRSPPSSEFPKEPELQLYFQVEVVSPGWLEFRLTDCSLADWLQNLINADFVKLANNPTKNTLNCFSIQYAHARCCSILAMAHQQGLIILKDGKLIEPDPIPWLQDESATPRQLCLMHPTEKRLIALFLDILEDRELEQRRGLKLALALSQAWEEFFKHCRIWGEVKTQTPKLAQARLGLVAVTQKLLRSLLQDYLGVCAPVEL